MYLESDLGDLEAEYRRHHLRTDQVSARLATIPWLVFTTYAIRADYLLLGYSPAFVQLLISKVIYLLLTLLVLVYVQRITQPSQLDWLILSWSLLTSAFVFWHESFRPRTSLGHYTIDVLIIVSLYVVPNRLGFRLILALLFTLFSLLGLFLYKLKVSPLDHSAIVVAILLANVLGFVTSTRLFTYRRNQFRSLMEERQAKEALAALARTDPLTGVLKRRAFNERGVEVFKQFVRYQHPFSVQVIDLDFFKNVNDRYGHQAGDETLKQFAQLVMQHKRETDIFGRMGGEEFALILPNTSAMAAHTLGERLRALMEATPIRLGDTAVPITLSMGVAEAQPTDDSFERVMHRADQLLYQAKRQGRNRVTAVLDVP